MAEISGFECIKAGSSKFKNDVFGEGGAESCDKICIDIRKTLILI
jgi:hypothetical protein